jgi:hypothetical protein
MDEAILAVGRKAPAGTASTWLYLQSEPSLWTVGYYDPQGKWHPESDHDSAELAAARVRWLNGGRD